MKTIPILGSLIFLFAISTSVVAQWKVIAIKPNAKILADGKPIKKGGEIKPTAILKFSKKNDYVRVYKKGRPPFTLAPGKNSKMEGKASTLIVPRKRIFSRGQVTLIEPIMTRPEAKIWLSGADKPLFFIKKAKLYFTPQVFQDTGKFYLVYKSAGKRKIKSLKHIYDINGKVTIVTFGSDVFKGITNPDKITNSALFIRPKGQKPRLISKFKPLIVNEPNLDFKKDLEGLIAILNKVYSKKALKRKAKKQKISPDIMLSRGSEYKFLNILDFFSDYYAATPDRNSIKMWLIKNYPKLQVPGKKN